MQDGVRRIAAFDWQQRVSVAAFGLMFPLASTFVPLENRLSRLVAFGADTVGHWQGLTQDGWHGGGGRWRTNCEPLFTRLATVLGR